MTLLHEAVEAKKFDTRMIERNVTRNVVAQDDVRKATDKLPDDADNADYISIEELAASETGRSSRSDSEIQH